MSAALAIQNFKGVILTLLPEFHLLKKQVLAKGAAIVAVTDTESQEAASKAASDIKRVLADLEKSRSAVKAPVIDLGRQIDAKAKEEAVALTKEVNRLTGLISTHYAAEAEKARKAQEMADALARKRQARLDAEAAEAEKERLRVADLVAQTESPEEASNFEQQAADADRKAEEARTAAANVAVKEVAAAPKADKMTVSHVWKFEVTDLAALYKARPELCKLEVRTAEINSVMAAGEREVPGLRIYSEEVVRIRG